jgi:threonine synthase
MAIEDIQTIATAITTGNPLGGDEILHKAYKHNWLAEDGTEEEILMGQRLLKRAIRNLFSLERRTKSVFPIPF